MMLVPLKCVLIFKVSSHPGMVDILVIFFNRAVWLLLRLHHLVAPDSRVISEILGDISNP